MPNRAQLNLRIYMDGRPPFDVTTRLADHNHWDMTRARHKWPTVQDAPVTWLAFMAWSAARRSGDLDMTWEAFLDACEGVENLDQDETAGGEVGGEIAATVDPIPAEPGPDWLVNSP
jgi:hypothetical protein